MTLEEIYADELLGDVKPSTSTSSTEEQRLINSFEEVNVFIDRHKRKPGETTSPSVSERSLKMRLVGLLNDTTRHELLRPQDKHGLLPAAGVAKPQTLDDILDFDDDLLATPQDDIFHLVHVKPAAAKPDETSSRRTCEEFDQFKPLFDQCAREINNGTCKTRRFTNEQEIAAGDFFILNGVTVYVAEVGETQLRNGKKNARLRLIFDNGTEGNNLLRSLATELYKDANGRRVITTDAGPLFSTEIDEGDTASGMLYVVKSLSADPEISKLDGMLHKIGFTSGTVEARTQNAKDDPTFLMAPVHPVTTYTLYNIDKVKLEHLLHSFFAAARLNIEIPDRFGKKVKPREWFLLPMEVIGEAISRLQDGSIVDYRFDLDSGQLVRIGRQMEALKSKDE